MLQYYCNWWREIDLHFTTSPQGHSTTCIKLLFHRLKIQSLQRMQGHLNSKAQRNIFYKSARIFYYVSYKIVVS